MIVLGLISGTSHDGIDAAIVEFGEPAEALEARLIHATSTPYDPELRARIAAALPPAEVSLQEVCELDTLIGQAFAEAAVDAIDAAGVRVDAVASHGQTVFHWIESGAARGTLQLGQPAWIAERTGLPVVSDLRSRDITVGGQGAPLVSFLDRLLFARLPGVTCGLNLGGIANVTIAREGSSLAYDIGPANALIDAVVVARQAHPLGYDSDGVLARQGTVVESLLTDLLAEPYYALGAPKSTGKELFNSAYVDAALARHARPVATNDLITTLTQLTARTVAASLVQHEVDTVVVSGGGARNPALLEAIVQHAPGVRMIPSDDLGMPVDDKEAIAFALLGWCTLHGLASTDPAATGAREPRILGSITPGAGPLVLPPPGSISPAVLVMSSSGGSGV